MGTPLKDLREELRIAQEDLAHQAGMRLGTYRKAEQGKNVSYTTAITILRTINSLRSNDGLPAVALDDLGLSIV